MSGEVWCDFEVMSVLLTVVVFLCESSRAFFEIFAGCHTKIVMTDVPCTRFRSFLAGTGPHCENLKKWRGVLRDHGRWKD